MERSEIREFLDSFHFIQATKLETLDLRPLDGRLASEAFLNSLRRLFLGRAAIFSPKNQFPYDRAISSKDGSGMPFFQFGSRISRRLPLGS